MDRILRGEIRWAELDPTRGHEQAGRRPVLILSADVFNAKSPVNRANDAMKVAIAARYRTEAAR